AALWRPKKSGDESPHSKPTHYQRRVSLAAGADGAVFAIPRGSLAEASIIFGIYRQHPSRFRASRFTDRFLSPAVDLTARYGIIQVPAIACSAALVRLDGWPRRCDHD